MSQKKRILFIHPDLGIGGAERLIVDAAVGLQDHGHSVTIYTSHCDPKHCFDEARNGTLKIRVSGNTIVPRNFLGRFSILCAILRQIHLTLLLLLSGEISNFEYLFIDQLSACIPLIKIFAPHITVLFYCHFPDYLLTARSSVVKSLYRIPFDWIEGFTTGLADIIVVNSKFTQSVFASAFPKIKSEPHVVYPCINTSRIEQMLVANQSQSLGNDGKRLLLSINRFERKKNIELAIRAFAGLTNQERKSVRLIIAGGYDFRVNENISYHSELMGLCESFNLQHITRQDFTSSFTMPQETDVLFLLSIPTTWKEFLLRESSLLLYTPEREHFGIVPLEALLAGLPVLAHNSGGPLETIEEGISGWLRPSNPDDWTAVIQKALFELHPSKTKEMGKRGQQRVVCEFSKEKMAERLESEFAIAQKQTGTMLVKALLFSGGVAVIFLSVAIVSAKQHGLFQNL